MLFLFFASSLALSSSLLALVLSIVKGSWLGVCVVPLATPQAEAHSGGAIMLSQGVLYLETSKKLVVYKETINEETYLGPKQQSVIVWALFQSEGE